MVSRLRAISLLALGLALGGSSSDADAAPSTPPPPKTQPVSPPPPSTSPSPFLPTPKAKPRTSRASGTTPPPPSNTPAVSDDGTPTAPPEPEVEPQDLSRTWGYSSLQTAVRPRYVRSNDPALSAPNPVGFYSGVSVQGNHVPPFPAKDVGAPPAVMTWTGFERAPEGSRVFFQLSAEANHTVDQKGQTIRIRIRNTKVNVRNNMRRLDLRYFKTPVRTVKVNRRGRDTVATIVLKREASPEVKIIDGKAGYKLLVVQFADGEGGGTTPPPAPAP